MKILILDNYDSFTYNLVQYLREISDATIDVFRNDKISLEAVGAYDVLVLSPGPGLPKDAGILLDLIKLYASQKPILGICLGHQAIGETFGGELEQLKKVYHGLATPITILNKKSIFKGQPDTITVGRYHSWVINKNTLPDCLEVLAVDEKGEIMAVQHQVYPVVGMQFHPESVLTSMGKDLLKNFMELAEASLFKTPLQ